MVTVPRRLAEPFELGPVKLRNRVFLAPMSGVTDAPFRRLAWRLGAGLVFSEMVASKALVDERRDMVRRVRSADTGPVAVQLAGREARWMEEGARIAEARGAEIIDINMGCPARHVTSGLSGSALMRDLDHALSLVDAVVGAVSVPVTLKMRLGWDESLRNAAELARRAEQSGVRLVTVHGRTRCQFFTGKADWAAIGEVRAAIGIPVVANGDLAQVEDAGRMMELSGADAVMVGRAALGRPWLPGQIARAADGEPAHEPSLETRRELVLGHHADMLDHYGERLGVRVARKHLAAYIAGAAADAESEKHWRGLICREEQPADVRRLIGKFFDEQRTRMAA